MLTKLLLLAALALPCLAHAEMTREQRIAFEQALAMSTCGPTWKPGTGATTYPGPDGGVILRGWIHSRIPGVHMLSAGGGAIKVFGKPQTVIEMGPLLYFRFEAVVPAGATLEWQRPDGVREPVDSMWLYPERK